MRNEDIKCWMDLHTKAIKGEIKAQGDLINIQIDSLEKKIDDNHEVVDKIKKDTLVVRLMHQHPKVSLFIVVLVICGIIFLSSNMDLPDFLKFLKR